jgi:NAD(P)-dependent dehydrogenase (short-subunit alcohol dehydrogenase family)
MPNPKTVLITGASRGIGLLAAKALAERGCYVYASMREVRGKNKAVAQELEPFGIESILIEPNGHGTDLVKTAPAPADNVCIDTYGTMTKGRDNLLDMFQDMFDLGDPGTDANNIATKIVELVEATGPRPTSTRVGHDMGVGAVNDAVAPIQAELIKGLKPVYMEETTDA